MNSLLAIEVEYLGRTYMPSKPRKYEIKIFWACEAQSGFALNVWIYTGKGREGGHKHLGKDVVLKLAEQFSGSGREIVTDNFFTSHELAANLLQMNLTLLGTMRNHRCEIPEEIRNKNRPVESSLFTFDHENKIMLVTYIPKKNKNVILLSSSHAGKHVLPQQHNKPELIIDYNFRKKVSINLMKTLKNSPVAEKLSRWPLLIFYNMLNVAAFDGYLLMKMDGWISRLKKGLFKESCEAARCT